jgi:[protein-PII] uridylyltransferase
MNTAGTLTVLDETDLAAALSAPQANLFDLLKQALSTGNAALRQAFDAGADTVELVHARARFIDQIMRQAFVHTFASCPHSIALLAVGGYGRGELHPSSDIDIMLLLDGEADDATRHTIERYLTLLWDIKLEIGHSVRTLHECVDEARKDITVATNIMEARCLCGDEQLFHTMQQRTGPDQIWDSRAFFQAKLDEQIKRHAKFHDTAYNLEPNVKENPGGLRDIQMIGWVAKRHFGARTLEELVTHGFLTRKEYDTLYQGQTLLWQIRLCLHYITGRREDRLLFDLQRELAKIFGYNDGENNLAIEQFMQRYYRTVMELERLNELLLQLFREEILHADKTEESEIINNRFQATNGYIEARYPQVFVEHPTALLEIFLILELKPEIRGVRAGTIRLMREQRYLIDDKFRHNETARKLFIDILHQPRGVTHELRRMNRYGILAAYIPAFEKIVGRMQYDLFHAYTVDQHTLFVVRNMRRLSVPAFAHEFPLASGIYHHLPKPELLFLAGLFHDIAKGRGGDHAILGAEDAYEFCKQHGLQDADSELVAWLVRQHLLMSMVAQRKDLSDPEVISYFARQVGDQTHLDYLYLLTLCDIRATNPKMWNSWKDNLLAELYHKTSSTLHMGLDNPVSRDMAIQEAKTSAQRLLDKEGYAPDKIHALWQHFSDDYFLHHAPAETVWHTKLILDPKTNQLPLVAARLTEKGRAEIFIYTHEHDELFAGIAATLDQLALNIVDAQIMATDNGFTLDSFKVLEADGRSPDSEMRIREIVQSLKKYLSGTVPLPEITRAVARTLKHFQTETKVRFEQQAGKDMTIMNIITADRPGLLARIGRAFGENRIRIHKAKIATVGEQADDTFLITDNHNQPLLNEEICQTLRASLIRHLSQ